MRFRPSFLITVFSVIVLPASSWAYQAAWMSLEQAQTAANLLKQSGYMRHYCEPCGDKLYSNEAISQVAVWKQSGSNYSVYVDGQGVDWYVYVKDRENQWRSLISLIGIEVAGVPAILPESFSEIANPITVPTGSASRQAPGDAGAQNGGQHSNLGSQEIVAKLGYVDVSALLSESAAGIKAQQEFLSFSRQMQASLDSQATSLEQFKKAMSRKAPYERITDENTLRTMLRDYREKIKQAQTSLESKRQELIGRAMEDISLAVRRYGAVEKYGLILSKESLSLLEKRSLKELVVVRSENTSSNGTRQNQNDKGVLAGILEGVAKGLGEYNETTEFAKRQNYHVTLPATGLLSGSEVGDSKKNNVLYKSKNFDTEAPVGVEDFDNITRDVLAFYDNKEGAGTRPAQGAASENKQRTPAIRTVPVIEGWEAVVNPGGQIFPSLVLATANLSAEVEHPYLRADDSTIIAEGAGFADKFFRVKVSCPIDSCEVKVVISSKGLMDDSNIETVIDTAGRAYTLIPKINWDYDALNKIKQPKPANVVFELFLNGQSQGKKMKTVRVRSNNDCPFYLIGEEGGQSMQWMYGAYVNEDHPWVDQILREALNTKIVDSFTGYLGGNDPAEVYRQVFAIWNVMQRRGLKYSNITTTSSEGTTVFSQHVRFMDESISNAQANCVDGSVLFASILRKIGIQPFLVLVPAHCFLGFYLDEAKTQIALLETTMMGHNDLADFPESNQLTDLLGVSKNNASWRTFNAAVQAGATQYNKYAGKFNANNPQLRLIDIGEARNMGIMPIASAGY